MRAAAMGLMLLVAGCAGTGPYYYEPAAANAQVGGIPAVDYPVPPGQPRGDVRVVSFGVTDLQSQAGGQTTPVLQVRLLVSNTGDDAPWTIDTRQILAVIGGEGNGGPIDPAVGLVRDSFVGMARLLDAMAGRQLKISQLADELSRYEIVKTKFECRREDANRAVEAVKAAFSKEKVDTQDGVRVDWKNSWVHARPSNTEPIMRIFAEAPTRAEAEEKVAAVQKVVNQTLGR